MGELRFVRQRKSNDCGVASLKMIIDYYLGGNVSYDFLAFIDAFFYLCGR
jgi:hypothetical protein